MLRLKCQGSSSEYCYIDDIEICYESTWEPEEPEYILGDVDGNGVLGVSDATLLISYLLNEGGNVTIDELAADMDKDGHITVTDATLLISMLLNDVH